MIFAHHLQIYRLFRSIWNLSYDLQAFFHGFGNAQRELRRFDFTIMLYAICYKLYAICYKLYAICYMLYAICYMLYSYSYYYVNNYIAILLLLISLE